MDKALHEHRPPAVAGMFYLRGPDELKSMIDGFLEKCKKYKLPPNSRLKALIVPHAGYVYSAIVAASGYFLLKENRFKRVISLGPSHYVPFRGAAFDSNKFWRTPLGDVMIENFKSRNIVVMPQAHEREHSIEVQLPFLQAILEDFSFCPITLGDSPKIDDDIIAELDGGKDEGMLLLISSDLSHYLPYKEAVKVDSATIKEILSLKEVSYDEACGREGINVLIRIAKQLKWKPVLIDYRNSGDTSGDKTGVVGYCCIAFIE
jgi:AmmeMemoRadiSam system protein B